MRKVIVLVLIVLLLTNLTGCGYITGRTSEMIDDYNKRVENTIITYELLKKESEENREELYSYILGETDNYKEKKYIKDLNNVSIEPGSHFVIRNDYFSALDAVALREVIILSGRSLVYVEVIWGADDVISITRRVI